MDRVLAIFAFSFSLLGAFLVRSGVLTSVHAFAVDPERGMFILAFLVLVIGGSLTLYAIKVSGIKSEAGFDWTARETMILANNLLLVTAAGAVLLGTLYPLIYEALTDGKKISVGPPYFNAVFVPLMLLLFAIMAVSPASRWKKTPRETLRRQFPALIGSLIVVASLVLAFATEVSVAVILIDTLALWIVANLVRDLWSKVANKVAKLPALFQQTMSYYGMLLGHLGIAVTIAGVCTTVYYTEEKDLRMAAGDVAELAGYEFRLNAMRQIKGPNYVADQGEVEVFQEGRSVVKLYPEKRFYAVSKNVMTEADIDPTLFRDLFVALGEPVGDDAWAVRIHYKPFVRWIWFGGLLIALGGFCTVLDRRYRAVKRSRQAAVTLGVAA